MGSIASAAGDLFSGNVGGAVGAAAGGLFGAFSGGSSKSSSVSSQLNIPQAGQDEQNYFGLQNNSLASLQALISGGANTNDYTTGINAQRALGGLYANYAQSGGLPNAEDVSATNGLASNLYAARNTQLQQSFIDQNTAEERLAAQLGRPINDPILQNKLRTGFLRQQDQLNAEQQGTATQLALQLPNQRLQYAAQGANVLGNLSSQAFNNQAYLLGLGSQLGGAERNFRLSGAGRQITETSGGGIGDILNGALASAGSGYRNASTIGNIFSGAAQGLGNLGSGISNFFGSSEPSYGQGSYSLTGPGGGNGSSYSLGGGAQPSPFSLFK